MSENDYSQGVSSSDSSNWFLNSFRAAQSAPQRFEFPEVDDSIDVSLDSQPSPPRLDEIGSENTGIGDVLANLSVTEDEDETTETERTPPRRPSFSTHKSRSPPELSMSAQVSPSLSYRSSSVRRQDEATGRKNPALPQLLPVSYRSEPVGIHSSLRRSRTHSSVVHDDQADAVRAHELTDRDWNYLRIICDYLDRHTTVDADDDLYSYNTADARDAARALGLAEPRGAVLTTLLQIGLDLEKFQGTARPWSTAVALLEDLVDVNAHAKFLEERRQEQWDTAQVLSSVIVKTQYLDIFRQAFRDDIKAADSILNLFESRKVKAVYFDKWKNVSQQQTKDSCLAKSEAKWRLAQTLISQWKTQLNSLHSLEHRVGDVQRRYYHQSVFKAWGNSNRELKLMMGTATDLQNKIRKRRCYFTWSQKYKKNLAEQIFNNSTQCAFLRRWRARRDAEKSRQQLSDQILKELTLKRWRIKNAETAALSQLNMASASAAVQCRQASRTLKGWQLNTRLCQTRRKLALRLRQETFYQWLLQNRVAVLQRNRGRTLSSQLLQSWRGALRTVYNIDLMARNITSAERESVLGTTVTLMRSALLKVKGQTHLEVPTYVVLARHKHLEKMVYLYASCQEQDSQATHLRAHFALRKGLGSIISSGEQRRTERLKRSLHAARESTSRRSQFATLKLWRTKTRRQRVEYSNVILYTDTSATVGALSHWRSMALKVRNSHKLANQVLIARYARESVSKWRALLENIEYLEVAAEDIDMTRLASVLKVKIRKWQRASSMTASQMQQAEDNYKRYLRSSCLDFLQRWHELILDPNRSVTRQGGTMSLANTSSLLYSNFAGANVSNKLSITPRSKHPMSPQALEKWRSNREARRQNPANSVLGSLTPLRPRITPFLGLGGDQSAQRGRQTSSSTPTKPFRSRKAQMEHSP